MVDYDNAEGNASKDFKIYFLPLISGLPTGKSIKCAMGIRNSLVNFQIPG